MSAGVYSIIEVSGFVTNNKLEKVSRLVVTHLGQIGIICEAKSVDTHSA